MRPQVTWDGPDDLENPQNWNSRSKWSAAWVVAAFSTIAPMSSAILSPSLHQMAVDFQVPGDGLQTEIGFSIYVLAWGVGPLFLGPLSELYGRTVVLQLGNAAFVAFTAGSGAAKDIALFIALRFLSGFAGSAALAVRPQAPLETATAYLPGGGGQVDDGMLTDMWSADELGRAVGLYSIGPLIGPAIAPIVGGFLTQYVSWRWSMYVLSIASAVVGVVGFFTLRETYGPVLLKRKARRLCKETGDPRYCAPHFLQSPIKCVVEGLVRPVKMLLTQVIIQALSLYTAYIFGLLYLFLSTFSNIWTVIYHESTSIGSLNYIGLSLGLCVGTYVGMASNDKVCLRTPAGTKGAELISCLLISCLQVYHFLKLHHDGRGSPELRAPAMAAFSILIPIGFLCYGWSAQAHTHWIVPNIGAAIFAFGGILSFQGIQAYVLEAYPLYGASAMAATTLLRSIASFLFPIFAPALYRRLDYGWGNTLLAGIAVVVGIPAPLFLYYFGARLREKSPYGTDRT